PMDWAGWLLLGSGLALLVFGFEFSGKGLVPRGVVPACLGAGALTIAAYVRRSRRTAHPIVDLSLLRIRTFRTAMVGGNLFRIAAGATTLLNPLMLQVGFGLSAAQSGALTFAGAVGALTMRTQVATLLRRIGFRRLLMADAAASAVLIGLCSALRPSTPHLLILALFLVIGYGRSLMFTSVNTLTYADVSSEQMSHATSFSATAQQVTLSLGVACAAQLLHVTLALAVSTIACVAVFRRLPEEAGANVSGHRVTTR
ncbi:MFS transporter, partial [bacterium]